MTIPYINSITGGWVLSVALKLFELLTYKFVTIPNYEFNTFSQIFRTIEYTFHALDDTLDQNVPF